MIKTENAEADYLLCLLKCSLLGGDVPLPQKEINHKALLDLANKQQVYNIILPSLQNAGILTAAEESAWNDCRLSELRRTIVVNNERAAICAMLDEAGIKYMFLKGLVIREYYPSSFMRQMSDNDILYDKAMRDKLLKIMKHRGFYLGTASENSDDFYKKPYCSFEMHRDLFFEGSEFCPGLNPWEHAKKIEGCRFEMSREDNYIYALAHMYKHYTCGHGCGVRFLCDMYLLSHSKDKLDWDYINSKFAEFGLAGFHRIVLSLADCVFGEKQPGAEEKALLSKMFDGGVFGKFERNITEEVNNYGGKFGWLMHRLFPKKSEMKAQYKVLEKKPFLLPFYYIYRLFDKYKHNKKVMMNDLKELKDNYSEDK